MTGSDKEADFFENTPFLVPKTNKIQLKILEWKGFCSSGLRPALSVCGVASSRKNPEAERKHLTDFHRVCLEGSRSFLHT